MSDDDGADGSGEDVADRLGPTGSAPGASPPDEHPVARRALLGAFLGFGAVGLAARWLPEPPPVVALQRVGLLNYDTTPHRLRVSVRRDGREVNRGTHALDARGDHALDAATLDGDWTAERGTYEVAAELLDGDASRSWTVPESADANEDGEATALVGVAEDGDLGVLWGWQDVDRRADGAGEASN